VDIVVPVEPVPGAAFPPKPLPADNLYLTDWVYRELQEAIAENRRQEETAHDEGVDAAS
jgi:hypothetical protein